MFALSGNCTLPNSVTYHVNVPERIFSQGRRVFSNKSPVNSSKRWTMGYVQLLEKKERKGSELSQGCARFRIAYRDFAVTVGMGRDSSATLRQRLSPRNFSFVFCPRSSHRRAIINRWTKKGLPWLESSRKRIKYGTGTPTWRRKWPFPRKMGLRVVF